MTKLFAVIATALVLATNPLMPVSADENDDEQTSDPAFYHPPPDPDPGPCCGSGSSGMIPIDPDPGEDEDK